MARTFWGGWLGTKDKDRGQKDRWVIQAVNRQVYKYVAHLFSKEGLIIECWKNNYNSFDWVQYEDKMQKIQELFTLKYVVYH